MVMLKNEKVTLLTVLDIISVTDHHNYRESKVWISDDMYSNKEDYKNSDFECCFDGTVTEAFNYIEKCNNELANRKVVSFASTENYIFIYVTDRDVEKFTFPLHTV